MNNFNLLAIKIFFQDNINDYIIQDFCDIEIFLKLCTLYLFKQNISSILFYTNSYECINISISGSFISVSRKVVNLNSKQNFISDFDFFIIGQAEIFCKYNEEFLKVQITLNDFKKICFYVKNLQDDYKEKEILNDINKNYFILKI